MQFIPKLVKYLFGVANEHAAHKHARKIANVLVVVILFTLSSSGCGHKETQAEASPPDVEVTDVVEKDVPIYGEWIAILDGYVNAQIQPQVTGYLMKQNYSEGTVVHRGEVLFEIDPRPFEAALEQAKGQLAQAEAQLGTTILNVNRDTPLARQSAIPQAQLDNDIQANKSAKAVVEAAQAQVQQAQLNLGFTKVRSLVDGIAGLAKGQIGDLVGPTKVLTTVSQVNPIKAYVSISDQEYLRVAARVNALAQGKRSDKYGQKNLELILSDGTTYPRKGWIMLADRQVDERTGTIRVACAFDNPDLTLRPGQFGRVRAATSVAKNALLVPQRSVVETQGTYSVVVVGADNKASIRPVKTGERVGQMWIINDGLKPGEQVIVEGIQKARPGVVVHPRQATAASTGATTGE
jgi:RND family efflux transporter MFP subunit